MTLQFSRLPRVRLVAGAFCLLGAGLLAAITPGCEPKVAAPPPPMPIVVQVAHPIVADKTQWDSYTGRLDAVETVEVKAQVSGFVDDVPFIEGSVVQKGDVLLHINPRIFQAQLDSANAAVMQAHAKLQLSQASLQLAENDLQRTELAAKSGVATAGELDTKRATVAQSKADIAAQEAAIAVAEAAAKSAQLNVDWCKVTAPISGRISNKKITPGNMLTGGPGQTTTITTITSIDPIYCNVDIDEAAVLKYQRVAKEKKNAGMTNTPVPCYMGLDDEDGYPRTGTIDFLDNHINAATGTRLTRGLFPNPDGALLPGSSVHFRLVGQEYKDALLVIDDAIGSDQDRKYVYVQRPFVGKDGNPVMGPGGKPLCSLERRGITVGPLIGEMRIVLSNLKPDDQVVINNLVTVGQMPPGIPFDPVTVPMLEHRLNPTAPANPAAPAQSRPAATEAAR